jgi:zinc-binding in reverse transcriptase
VAYIATCTSWYQINSIKFVYLILSLCYINYNYISQLVNLAKRIWISEVTCPLCAEPESVSHLFLKCNVAMQIWFWMGHSQNYFMH